MNLYKHPHINSMKRRILHADMDAFYASVEQVDNPEFRGKPVIVGGDKRGVVSAASYEARKFGVRSAMPIFQAKRLCPHGIFLPVRGKRYREISNKIMNILCEFSPLVEKVSIDEAFLDITGTENLLGKPEKIARKIKDKIKSETLLTCSIGIAPNKLLAKIASDMDKPDGLTIIREQDVETFMRHLPAEKLPGIGKQTAKELRALGIKTASDILRFDLSFWINRFGKHGYKLYEKAQGKDKSPVEPFRKPKSFGAENTFPTDITDREDIKKWILIQCEKVARELRARGYMGRKVTLKIKFSDFKLTTRTRSLPDYTNCTKVIFDTAMELLAETKLRRSIRLTGVTVSGLSRGYRQMGLIEDKESLKQEQIDKALDHISNKFGENALKRGILIP